MRVTNRTKFLILGVVTAVLTTSAQADLLGTWRTEKGPEGGYADLNVQKCAQKYCATVKKAYGAEAVVPSGTLVVRDMVKRGTRYEGGEVFLSRFDRWINLTITESDDGNTAVVSTCVGPVCRKQNWQRLP